MVDGSSMEILIVASELAPYARASVAAESVAALSKSLRQLGHEVSVAMPRYPGFEQAGLQLARRLSPLPLRTGGEVTVYDGQLPSGVRLVVFDAPILYDRHGVLGTGDGVQSVDTAKRVGLLAQASTALVRQRVQQGHAFDLLHLHDWPAALVAVFARMEPGPDLPIVVTVHDGAEEGRFTRHELGALGLTLAEAEAEGLLDEEGLSVLRAAISRADVVTADSPSYSAELADSQRYPEFAGALRAANKTVVGILNGVDYATWNPATDPVLASRFDAEESGGKMRSKTAFLREHGMEVDLERPLVAVVQGTGQDATGDVVASSLAGLAKLDVALVLAGVPETPELAKRCEWVRSRCGARFHSESAPSDAFLHRLLAAADFVVVLSRRAPNGLMAMKGQRYGVVPIVCAAGAHRDCVIDADASLTTGTGFLFDELSHTALTGAVQRAVSAYGSPGFPKFRRRVMRLDLGWDRAARRYVQLYKQALGAKA